MHMKKKINHKFMLISAIAIVVIAICSMILFYDILKKQIFDDLKANAHVISMMNPEKLPEEVDYNLNKDGLRISLIDPDGTVIYDSFEDKAKLENHKNRPEIAEAIQSGEGYNMRKSATSAKHTFYYAMRMDNGNILRIGKDSKSIYSLVFNMSALIVAVGIIVFILCACLAHRLTKRLVAPIEKMADNIVLLEENDVYDEMKPFVSMIKQQHVDILKHSQMRQEFTANVSHELKTPLTAISGYAELIASGMTSGEDTIHFATEIHKSAERLQYLINDIIKLSELDSDETKMEFEMIDLHELALNCQAMMELQAEKNEVTVEVEGYGVELQANRNLIEELIYNLCSNAVRYNKKGGKVILLTEREDGHPILIVKDTGIGIPKESQKRVFERFYRVDKSRSKSTGGTGLGLAIVKHIVAQHNAQISLESEVGVGTTIKVTF